MKLLSTASKIIVCLDEWNSIFDPLDKISTIDSFVKKVELMAPLKFPNASNDRREEDKLNSFKGDMLEVLCEIFFNIYASDPAVGLLDYTPVSLADDYGVDGIGRNVNGDHCAIQIKYRSNPLELIPLADMAKTYAAGRLLHGLPLNKDNSIFLFTTGKGITAPCHYVFNNIIRVIDRQIISGLIDNNQNFVDQAENLICETIKPLIGEQKELASKKE